jgi:adenylate kinase family enzyme
MNSPLIKSPQKSKVFYETNTKNDLYTESNPVNRFEKFQKEQQIMIKEQNQIQEDILKNEKNVQHAKPLKSIDEDLFMKKSEKNEIKHQEEQNLILKQSMDQKQVEEMNKGSEFYKIKIMDRLNLNNKTKLVVIDNFEKSINKLGIDLASIDPKLKKLSKLNVSSDVLLKKIQDRIHLDEVEKRVKFDLKDKQSLETKKIKDDFIKRNEKKKINASFNNFNKPTLKNINEISIDTSSNLNHFSPLEKRIEYENYRNIINRDLLKEKKRKTHEMKIRDMYLNYQSPNNNQEKDSFKEFDNKQFFKDLLKENLKERQINLTLKIKQRKVNKVHMHKLANYIIDFVEEIFNYQSENNSEEIKIEDWRSWTSMFINNQPYSVSLKSSISYFEHDKTAEENDLNNKDPFSIQLANNNFGNENITKNKFIETQDLDINSIDSLFEECELLDYLFFRGKYQVQIIPQEMLNKMLDIFEIIGNDMLSKTGNSNKFKSSQFNNYKEYEPKDEDIENLTIPKTYNKNYLLTDIIDVILDLKFSEENFEVRANKTFDSNHSNLNNINNNHSALQIKHKHPLKHIPIKIVLTGRSFAGKKTQAKLISENYPIKIYSVSEIINKNFEILERLEIPVDQNPKYKNFKKNELDKISADRQIEEQKFEPIKSSTINLKLILEDLENSQAKKDEAIIDFCIEIIKADFPEKLTSQILDEIASKQKRKKDINEEIIKLKEDKNNPKTKIGTKNESQYQQELNKISIESNKGFILVDFPNNFSQANILEQKLSGYVYELSKPKSDIEKMRDNYSQILDKTFKPPKKKILIEGGLDVCIYLDGDSNECIRRSQNRKIDPTTGMIYHLDDNPPNQEDKKLLERLIGTEEIQPVENLILESHKEFNININKILEFYSIFGYSKMNFKMMNKIPIIPQADDSTKDYKEQVNHICHEITQIINHIIKINDQKETEFLAQHTNVSSQKEVHFGNHRLNGTQTNSQLGYTNNNNLINPANIIHSVNNSVLNTSMNKDFNAGTQNNINQNNDQTGNEFEKNNVEIISSLQVQNLDEDDFNKYHRKFQEAKKKISSLVTDEIYSKWLNMFETYNSSLRSVFRSFKKQKESIINNYNKLQEKFIDFLRRTSKKHLEIQKFQTKFNRFSEEYPELKTDEQVKAEFHQDLADLGDGIWEIIDERKDEAIEERKKIMNSGWIEKEMEKFYYNAEKVFIMEVEKFYTSLIIIRQFYLNMDSRLYHEISGFKPLDILKEDDFSSIPLEKVDEVSGKFTFPRIEKIYKNAIKIILKFDEIVKSQEKIIVKNSTVNISLDISMKKASILKRGATNIKKQLIDSTFVDDKREIFMYEEEMKNAIKFEKNKFKYRVTFLKFWAINNLNNMKRVTKQIYDKLDEWIINSIKAENDAMNNLTFYLDSHIESETKVKCEMEMDSFEIFRIVNVLEFFESEVTKKLF